MITTSIKPGTIAVCEIPHYAVNTNYIVYDNNQHIRGGQSLLVQLGSIAEIISINNEYVTYLLYYNEVSYKLSKETVKPMPTRNGLRVKADHKFDRTGEIVGEPASSFMGCFDLLDGGENTILALGTPVGAVKGTIFGDLKVYMSTYGELIRFIKPYKKEKYVMLNPQMPLLYLSNHEYSQLTDPSKIIVPIIPEFVGRLIGEPEYVRGSYYTETGNTYLYSDSEIAATVPNPNEIKHYIISSEDNCHYEIKGSSLRPIRKRDHVNQNDENYVSYDEDCFYE